MAYAHDALRYHWGGRYEMVDIMDAIIADHGQASREYAAFMSGTINMRAIDAADDGDLEGAWLRAQGDVGEACRGE